jgi:hypothetical protein
MMKKMGITIFLVMCLAGFTLNLVCAEDFETSDDTTDLNKIYRC